MTRAAQELYKKSGHKVKGMTIEIYGWLMEEALANAHTSLINNGDGHTGNPTKINLNNPTTKKFLKWIRTNIKSGDFVNYGSGASAETNEIAAFLANKLGIFVQSSAYIGQLTTGTKTNWEFHTPHPDGVKANGVWNWWCCYFGFPMISQLRLNVCLEVHQVILKLAKNLRLRLGQKTNRIPGFD